MENATLGDAPTVMHNNAASPTMKTAREDATDMFRVGDMVDVQARMWPGINRHGGVGRVMNVHQDEQGALTHVDVKYIVVGGRERLVPVEYVALAPQFEQSNSNNAAEAAAAAADPKNKGALGLSLRDRSHMLGRCTHCGSLRLDCGSCDWNAPQTMTEAQPRRRPALKHSSPSRSNHQRMRRRIILSDDSSASSDEHNEEEASESEDSMDAIILTINRNHSRVTKKKRVSRKEKRNSLQKREKRRSSGIQSRHGQTSSATESAGESMDLHATGSSNTELDPLQDGYVGDDVGDSDTDNTHDDNNRSDDSSHSGEATHHMATLMSDAETESDGIGNDIERECDIDREFIQEEGLEADLTKGLSFIQLPDFIDSMLNKITNELLPATHQTLADLTASFDEAILITNDSKQKDRLHELDNKIMELYHNEFLQNVIRMGADQCQHALRKLEDKRQLRSNKHLIPVARKSEFGDCACMIKGNRIEALDVQLKVLKKEIEHLYFDRLVDAFDKLEPRENSNDSTSGESDNCSQSDVFMNNVESNGDDIHVDGESNVDDIEFHPHASKIPQNATKPKRIVSKRRGKRKPKRGKDNLKSRRTRTWERTSKFERYTGQNSTKLNGRKRQRRTKESDVDEITNETNENRDPWRASAIQEFGLFDSDTTNRIISTSRSQRSCGAKTQSVLDDWTEIYDADKESSALTDSRADRVPIGDRMESFLNSNSDNVVNSDNLVFETMDSTSMEISPGDRDCQPRQETQTQSRLGTRNRSHGRHRKNRSKINRPNANSSRQKAQQRSTAKDPPLAPKVTAELLFHSFEQEDISEETTNTLVREVSDSKTLAESCDLLLETYPASPHRCLSLLRNIRTHIRTLTQNSTEVSDLRFHAVNTFQTFLELLQKKAYLTLTEMIQIRSPHLRIHLDLLTHVIWCMKDGLHKHLMEEDGLIFCVFDSVSSKSPFLEFVTLQLLDVAYSLVLPLAWNTRYPLPLVLFELLVPLRDALAQAIPITERVCRLVMNQLECQKYWQSSKDMIWYTSSIDPLSYNSFLTAGEKRADAPEMVRFRLFKKEIPRSEVDALWAILAFIGTSSGQLPAICGSIERWKLIQMLLFSETGILCPPSDGCQLGPNNPDRMECCEQEILSFSLLVSYGAMNPLPNNDGILIKVIEKAVSLEALDVNHVSRLARSLLPQQMGKEHLVDAQKVWDATNLLTPFDANIISSVLSFSGLFPASGPANVGSDFGKDPTSTSPSSTLLNHCTALLKAWMQHLPPGKKARWNRLKSSVKTCISNLEQKSKKEESECDNAQEKQITHEPQVDIETEFGNAFPLIQQKFSSDNTRGSPGSFYKEAAAYLLLHCSASHQGPVGLCTRGFSNQVWQIVSDDVMKRRQVSIAEHSTITEELLSHLPTYMDSLHMLYMSAKIMTIVVAVHVHQCQTEQSTPDMPHDQASDENGLTFLFSCLLAILSCACDKMLQTQEIHLVSQASHVVACISYWLSCTMYSMRQLGQIPASQVIEASKLQSWLNPFRKEIFDMVSRHLSRCVRTIAESSIDLGVSGDVSFCSCLSTLRSAVALTHACNANVTNKMDDPFGDLDDNLFCSLHDGGPVLQPNSVVNAGKTLVGSTSPIAYEPAQHEAGLEAMLFWSSCLAAKEVSPSSKHTISLIARHVGGICSSLASICSLQLCEKVQLSFLFDKIRGNGKQCDVYIKHVQQCLCSEICHLAKSFTICNEIIKAGSTIAMSCCIEAMLDSDTLELFSSCSFDNVRKIGGEPSEQKERKRVLDANLAAEKERKECSLDNMADIEACGVQKLKRGIFSQSGPSYMCRNMWKFSQEVSYILGEVNSQNGNSNHDEGTYFDHHLGIILTKTQNDDLHILELVKDVSLERECLKRLLWFHKVVSLVVTYRSNLPHTSIEATRLVAFIAKTCITQLIRIAEGIAYRNSSLKSTATSDALNDKKRRKLAKLRVMQMVYSELTICIMSSVLCNNHLQQNQGMSLVEEAIIDFILSICRKNSSDILTDLKKVACAFSTTSNAFANGASSYKSSSGSCSLVEDLRRAIYRRTKELIIHDAFKYAIEGDVSKLGFYDILMKTCLVGNIEQGIDGTKIVTLQLGLFLQNYQKGILPGLLQHDRNRFEIAVDEYFGSIIRKKKAGPEEAGVYAMRKNALQNRILSELESRMRKKALCLLQSILDTNTHAQVTQFIVLQGIDTGVGCLEFESEVCPLAKGLSRSLQETVLMSNPDDATIDMIYACSTALVNLQVDCNQSKVREKSCFLLWCKMQWCQVESIEDIDNKKFTKERLFATYFWKFSVYMYTYGTMLINETDTGKLKLAKIRNERAKEEESHEIVWSSMAHGDMDLSVSEIWTVMISLEQELFQSRQSKYAAANPYAKAQEKCTGKSSGQVSHLAWSPSSDTKKVVKLFIDRFDSLELRI